MIDPAQTRGLLSKNAEIRNEMLRRKAVPSKGFFYIDGKQEYQDIFSLNNNLEDNASLRYVNLMSLNAYLNKDRFLSQKYITPSLTEFYGTNPQIDGNIGYYNIFNAHNGTYHKETGRIVDDYNEGVHFIELNENSDLTTLQEENGGIYYFLQNIEKSKKENNTKEKPSRRFVYDWKLQYSKENVDSENFLEEDNVFIPQIKEVDYGKIENNRQDIINDIYNHEVVWENEETGENGKVHESLLTITNRLFKHNRLRSTQNTNTKILKSKHNNTYVRNWSKYKNYNDSVKNLAGNYKVETENNTSLLSIQDIQEGYSSFRSEGGVISLTQNTVLRNTGFVNIVRGRKEGNGTSENIKKCMFSIENLAWKDVPDNLNYLSEEQRGPNGGRIMWFPPYNISFNENISVNWNPNTFIGRGEKIYTYTDTDRRGQISFLLLIDYPNILNTKYTGGNTEEDYLRFFAGEQLLQAKAQKEEIVVEKHEQKRTDSSIYTGDKDGKQITFSIYFPNNYSGLFMVSDSENINKTYFKSYYSQYIDPDWWCYLLIGNDCSYIGWDNEQGWDGDAVPLENWRGYEMRANNGLTCLSCEDKKDGNYAVYQLTAWRKNNSEGNIDEEHQYRYRTDFDMGQRLLGNSWYYDTTSSMLNSQKVPNGATNIADSDGKHFSFAEVVLGILRLKNENSKYQPLESFACSAGAIDVLLINEIETYFKNYKIEKIDISSHASEFEGDMKYAEIIAERREYAVLSMLKSFLGSDVLTKVSRSTKPFVEKCNDVDVNSEEQKRARRVDVTISFETSNTTTLSNTAGGLQDNSGNTVNNVINQNNGYEPQEEESDQQNENPPQGGENNKTENTSRRYENEADYFERITEEKSLTYNTITEKIKYFNPAFHSISPEGFNARLTFLQQCTRQGHTIEASDKNGFAAAAGNLAFGRMPVCVLSLGDFINTRILINSLGIDFSDDGINWDLNKTGIGVQPMFAKITLDIILLGGQSLGGPISRLQNAVSFNYYANTEVYDDRADRVILGGSTNENGNYEVTENYEKPLWAPYPKEEEKKETIKKN
jgi:hypothetical protein